jgi:hypothetical protein
MGAINFLAMKKHNPNGSCIFHGQYFIGRSVDRASVPHELADPVGAAKVAEALNRRHSVRRSCRPIAALQALRLVVPVQLRLGGKCNDRCRQRGSLPSRNPRQHAPQQKTAGPLRFCVTTPSTDKPQQAGDTAAGPPTTYYAQQRSQDVKTLIVIATLLASPPLLAQTVQPAQHKSGIVDTLIERADTLRCAVIRDDLPDDALLSGCQEPAK